MKITLALQDEALEEKTVAVEETRSLDDALHFLRFTGRAIFDTAREMRPGETRTINMRINVEA